jgi:transcriptional regulator with XRE-family HTH domain
MGERLAWRPNTLRLDRERVLRGLSQERLALAAHVDPDTLSDLLAQRRRPQLGTLSAIAAALDLQLADVLEFES